jgi:hypothetical protein
MTALAQWIGSVRAGADFFVFKGSAGGWIDDGVGAVEWCEACVGVAPPEG